MNDPSDLENETLATHANVTFLVNFVAPNMIAVCQEVAKRVGQFTVLSSVEMESNRDWQSDWQDLDVRVQRTFTITRHPKHPGGYREVNYIHVPVDTLGQLARIRPDVIVTLELGARTGMSSIYRMTNRSCVHVMSVFASERSEAGRGRIRALTRRRLLRRADWITYNGPSCQRLITSLGGDPSRMSAWDYAADPRKPYRGERSDHSDRSRTNVLTVGQLSERKGVLLALRQLRSWCSSNPDRHIRWNVVGSGPLESEMRSEKLPPNLNVVFHGHCEPERIADHYRDNDLMLFPTLGDEWGLVVDEAFFSGLPVIGSCHAQAVTTMIRDGRNGMIYDPEQNGGMANALDGLMMLSADRYKDMPSSARQTVASRTPADSAEQLIEAINSALRARKKIPSSTVPRVRADHHRVNG